MKKLILAIIAVIVVGNMSFAQNNDDNRESFQFGIKIGANYSNVFDTRGDDFVADPKIGFAAGGFLSIPIGAYFAVQPELLFSQKGFKATGKILATSYEFSRTTNYIDIPVLFAFRPIENISILIGPQYSYLIKQSDNFSNTSTLSNVQQETIFSNDNVRKNTFCLIFGADVNIDHLVIGGRIGRDLYNNNGDGTSTTPRYKNVWYQLTIGFRFFND